MLQVNKWRAP